MEGMHDERGQDSGDRERTEPVVEHDLEDGVLLEDDQQAAGSEAEADERARGEDIEEGGRSADMIHHPATACLYRRFIQAFDNMFEAFDRTVRNGFKMLHILEAFDNSLIQLRKADILSRDIYVKELMALADPAGREAEDDICYRTAQVVLTLLDCNVITSDGRVTFHREEMRENVTEALMGMKYYREKIESMMEAERRKGGVRADEVADIEAEVLQIYHSTGQTRPVHIPRVTRGATIPNLEWNELVLPVPKWFHHQAERDIARRLQARDKGSMSTGKAIGIGKDKTQTKQAMSTSSPAVAQTPRKLIIHGPRGPPSRPASSQTAAPGSILSASAPTAVARPNSSSSHYKNRSSGNKLNHNTGRYTLEEKISVMTLFPKRLDQSHEFVEQAHWNTTGVSNRTFGGLRQQYKELSKVTTLAALKAEKAKQDGELEEEPAEDEVEASQTLYRPSVTTFKATLVTPHPPVANLVVSAAGRAQMVSTVPDIKALNSEKMAFAVDGDAPAARHGSFALTEVRETGTVDVTGKDSQHAKDSNEAPRDRSKNLPDTDPDLTSDANSDIDLGPIAPEDAESPVREVITMDQQTTARFIEIYDDFGQGAGVAREINLTIQSVLHCWNTKLNGVQGVAKDALLLYARAAAAPEVIDRSFRAEVRLKTTDEIEGALNSQDWTSITRADQKGTFQMCLNRDDHEHLKLVSLGMAVAGRMMTKYYGEPSEGIAVQVDGRFVFNTGAEEVKADAEMVDAAGLLLLGAQEDSTLRSGFTAVNQPASGGFTAINKRVHSADAIEETARPFKRTKLQDDGQDAAAVSDEDVTDHSPPSPANGTLIAKGSTKIRLVRSRSTTAPPTKKTANNAAGTPMSSAASVSKASAKKKTTRGQKPWERNRGMTDLRWSTEEDIAILELAGRADYRTMKKEDRVKTHDTWRQDHGLEGSRGWPSIEQHITNLKNKGDTVESLKARAGLANIGSANGGVRAGGGTADDGTAGDGTAGTGSGGMESGGKGKDGPMNTGGLDTTQINRGETKEEIEQTATKEGGEEETAGEDGGNTTLSRHDSKDMDETGEKDE